jgi:hypothetical protein
MKVLSRARRPGSVPRSCGLPRALALSTLTSLAACSGEIADGRAPGAGPRPAPGQTTPSDPAAPPKSDDATASRLSPACRSARLATAPARMLSRFEYNNTVRDLLGIASAPAKWDEATPGSGFDNDAVSKRASTILVDMMRSTAEEIAEQVDVAKLLPCAPADAGCGEKFLQGFGRRAFRRPLSPAERTRFGALLAAGQEGGSFEEGARLVISAMLQSPHFLYRYELDGAPTADGSAVRLSDHGLASRLSYFLWSSMPDYTLLDAADGGRLRTPEQIAAQVDRMLEDPRATETLAHFHTQWLGLAGFETEERDPNLFPGYDASVGAAMRSGTLAFLEEVTRKGDVAELLTASWGFANGKTASFIGATGVTGEAVGKVTLDPSRRSGLLTDPGLMTRLGAFDHTNVVGRGLFVRSSLLCQTLMAAPDDVPDLPELSPDLTTRELFKQHRELPACAGCHQFIDPIGFGFENYDAVGRYRTTERGHPIDASGELVGTRDADGPFNGAVELGKRLAASTEVRDCVATQWFRFAFGRSELPGDECTLEEVKLRFADGKGRLRDLLVAMTKVPAFGYRAVDAADGPAGGSEGGCAR